MKLGVEAAFGPGDSLTAPTPARHGLVRTVAPWLYRYQHRAIGMHTLRGLRACDCSCGTSVCRVASHPILGPVGLTARLRPPRALGITPGDFPARVASVDEPDYIHETDMLAFVHHHINSCPLVIFASNLDIDSRRAVHFFWEHRISARVIDYESLSPARGDSLHAVLENFAGVHLFPYIFIGGAYMGRWEEVAELHARGDLAFLLREAGIDTDIDIRKPFPPPSDAAFSSAQPGQRRGQFPDSFQLFTKARTGPRR